MSPRPAISQKTLINSPLKPVLPARPGERLVWRHLLGSSRGLVIAMSAMQYPGPVLVITPNALVAQQLEDEIRFYDPRLPILPFPDWECLPYDVFSPHQDIISQRLATLSRLPNLARGIVLAPIPPLLHRLPPRDYVASHSFLLEVGDRLNIDSLRQQLTHGAYQNVSQVMEPGEFAVRGGLIDLFPMGSRAPYRIDLFGDEVESIHEFDPNSQRSGKSLNHIRLLPAREYPLTESAIQHFRQAFRARFEGDPQKVPLYRDISKGLSPPGIEYYLPLFFDQTMTFFDYLPKTALCILDSGVEQAAQSFRRETEERYAQLQHDRERPLLPPAEFLLGDAQLRERLNAWPCIELAGIDVLKGPSETAAENILYDTKAPVSLPVNHKSDTPYHALFEYLRTYAGRVLIVTEAPGRRETLRALLNDNDFQPTDVSGWGAFLHDETKLGLTAATLEKGVQLRDPALSVITEPQLYGERVAQRRRRARPERDPDAIIRSLVDLRIGDPVVHEDHGVGRYLGLQTLDVGDGPTEFLALEYAGNDKLYIPVLALHLISRYTGTDPEHAPLHKLGGEAWERAKQRARAKAHDAAVELLEIQALRAARKGHAFPVHNAQFQAFADAFAFEETPDQARTIDEVLKDMETEKSMDRLVCGDVGFGKTEVAMRAAFLAVQGEMQVAVLVPTTLLAQQHYQNFSDRFSDVHGRTSVAGDRMSGATDVHGRTSVPHRDVPMPRAQDDVQDAQVSRAQGRAGATAQERPSEAAGLHYRIELLSRFRSKADQAKVLQGLARGAVDIVIGTHRLLQSDVRFKRLGLLILDEEHRFGVRQKERLKKLRSEVDILTLTATPIPRTLNMALAGLRDISIIATAPEGRLTIKTLVSERNRGLIREACLREIRRGGQVYYLHNEVRTIDKATRQLQELVPKAEIRIAHGQMPERELERIMLDFYHQRFHILVCSTIIESGIDVPAANTIIIERADKFGLGQLHQLRGRVGRSHHRAYAYLLIPGHNVITEDARKRLEAIESLGELGAGFTLASHDLEIRGAGELLGEAQSGEIDEVGFTLYSELLNRAVKSLKAGRIPDDTGGPAHSVTEVNLHAPALLPEDYLPDVHMRLILYKRIAGVSNLDALQELQEELIDRFGLLPEAGKLLFKATEIKVRATPLGIHKIDAGKKGVRIEFIEQPNIDPGVILRLLDSGPGIYKLDGPNRLRIVEEMPDVEDRISALRKLLDLLATYH